MKVDSIENIPKLNATKKSLVTLLVCIYVCEQMRDCEFTY